MTTTPVLDRIRDLAGDGPISVLTGAVLSTASGIRAYRLGKPIFAINRGTTRADPLLAARIEGDCGRILASLAAQMA